MEPPPTKTKYRVKVVKELAVAVSYTRPEDVEEGLAMDIQEKYHSLGMSLEALQTEYDYVHPNVIACIL